MRSRWWVFPIYIALFFIYAWLPLQGFSLWNSPDEMAVAFASDPEANGFGLSTPEISVGEKAGGLIHPRSMTVLDGRLVPTGFLGWPWLLRWWRETPLSQWWVFVPALLGAGAVLAFGDTIRRVSGKKSLGWLSAFLLATHPAWWYFANRGLLPNVAFMSFVILAFWGMVRASQEKNRAVIWAWLSGVSLGLAGFVRLNEMLWLIPCVIVFGYWQWEKAWRAWLVMSGGLFAAMFVSFCASFAVYGSVFAMGYTLMTDVAPVISLPGFSEMSAPARGALAWLFPFGVHEMNILRNAWHYLGLPAWFSSWALIGMAWLVAVQYVSRQTGTRLLENFRLSGSPRLKQGACLFGVPICFGLVISAAMLYLLVLYGSWNVSDNPTPGHYTIGVSYMRYWLPIFAMGSVIGAWAMLAVAEKMRVRWGTVAWRICMAVMMLGSVGSGAWQTFSGMEGLVAVRATLQENTQKKAWVLARTHSYDAILTIRDDKVLFPDRTAVTGFLEPGVQARLASLEKAVREDSGRLFYFGPRFSVKDEEYLEEQIFAPQGLRWEMAGEQGDSVLMRLYHASALVDGMRE